MTVASDARGRHAVRTRATELVVGADRVCKDIPESARGFDEVQ